ncbi:MAG TPA: S8 family serine peptidase, partial [Anaerolineae bacterium]|nr:S8 family serine peptidase [Anaerolineae bacterium]
MRTFLQRFLSALMLVVLALSLIYPAGIFAAASVSRQPSEAAQAKPGPQLLLRFGAFDPAAETPNVPPALQRTLATNEAGLRIVQFTGPIQDDWYTAMIKAGLEVVTYLPDYAYVVWGDGAAMARLQANAPVRWSGVYQPAYALSPDLAAQMPDAKPVAVTVQLYNHAGVESTLHAIEAQADRVLGTASPVLVYLNVRLSIATDQLDWLASQPDVVNVEPYAVPHKLDEIQDQIMAGNLNAAGTQPSGPGYIAWLTGTIGFTTTASAYPIVDVTDDGIDNGTVTPLHPDFWTFGITNTVDRLIYNYNWTTNSSADGLDGHGNLNASIVVGYNNKVGTPYEDGSGFNFGLGVNPFGRVAGSKVFANGGSWSAPATNTPIISNTYALGARISTNSWGADTGGAYNTDDQEYDSLVRDAQPGTGAYAGNQPMITVFAAGNAGSGSNTVGSPGSAKNVISVGASENYRPTWTDGCAIGPTGADNAQDIISFSSRGPTDDSRYKPDIVAPGTHIEGAASQDPGYNGSGVCDQYMPASQTLYAASSGTSHSTPAVAGAASLLYRYYQDHFGGQPPSPAMTKAYLVNATRYLTGTSANDTLPSNNQGLGEINLGTAFDTAKRLTVDQTAVLGNSGEVYQLRGGVADSSKPFRVTLAWTDAPGPTTGNAYVNNLDLAVQVGGQTYLGNVFSGRNSITGGSADPRNNVESVFLPAGTSGAFTIIITGTNIAGDGVPGNADATDQDFALVVYNAAQDLGVLQGAVTAAGTGTPIVGASVQAASSGGSGSTTSGVGGLYSMSLLTGTYTITATAYGYQPNSIGGVVINKDVTTTQNITLTPVSNYYVVSGRVTDASAGWPLPATIAIAGYPTGTIATDPATGLYSVTLPGGSTYDFSVSAAGYLPAARSIGPLTADRTEDFALAVDQAACTAPGYHVTGWSENFDSVSVPGLPAGWATTVVTSSSTLANWLSATATVHPSGVAPHSPPNLIYFNSYSAQANGANRLYRTTGLNMTTMPTTTLSFWMYHDTGYTTNADRVQVQVSINGGTTWMNVGAPVNRYDGSTGWKQHSIDLSAYAAQTDLRLGLLG